MRDILSDLEQGDGPKDPVRAAQASMRQPLPKRFYAEARAAAADGGFGVLLDGKPLRTPQRKPLVLPTLAAAEILADEWRARREIIDPAGMPATRIANTALDGVAGQEREVLADLLRFAGNDLLCYRAGAPRGLVDRQAAAWDPPLAWCRDRLGANFICVEGVNHVEQPGEAVAALGRRFEAFADPLRFACLHAVTTLGGSAILALCLAEGAIDAEAVWKAANIDEDWNVEHWGEDEEASQRRAFRRAEMNAAASLFAAAG
jgi:chaperone required for assembly of F1-ATPase